MDRLVLADIIALSSSTDYGGRGFLQSSSAVLALSGALFLSELSLWQGVGSELTDGEIDTIKAMVAQLENDLIETGEMYPLDVVKVTNSENIETESGVVEWLSFDTEIYDPQDMHSLVVEPGRIYAVREGLHVISAAVSWGSAISGVRRLAIIKTTPSIPLTTILLMQELPYQSVGGKYRQTATTQDYLLEGDYLRLQAYQTAGVNIDLIAEYQVPVFSAARM